MLMMLHGYLTLPGMSVERRPQGKGAFLHGEHAHSMWRACRLNRCRHAIVGDRCAAHSLDLHDAEDATNRPTNTRSPKGNPAEDHLHCGRGRACQRMYVERRQASRRCASEAPRPLAVKAAGHHTSTLVQTPVSYHTVPRSA